MESMNSPMDPILMEARYESLRDTLRELSDLLVHSSDDTRVLEVFRSAKGTAAELFQAEELAMESMDCPVLEANRSGHRKFMRALDEVQEEARLQRLGIHAAGILRREILPWLHDHHSIVDRQLLPVSSDLPGSPFRARSR